MSARTLLVCLSAMGARCERDLGAEIVLCDPSVLPTALHDYRASYFLIKLPMKFW